MEQLIKNVFVPYIDTLPLREMRRVDTIVIHATEIPTIEGALQLARKITDKVKTDGICAHYYISRKGTLYRAVPDDRTANHCVGWNRRSLGVELVNRGRYPHWSDPKKQRFFEKFTESQYHALNRLLLFLKEKYPWVRQCLPHSKLDRRMVLSSDGRTKIRRRIDPGPLFDWSRIVPID